MPKVAVVSDVHLEFGSGTIENKEAADILLLAGDICVAEDLKRHPVDATVVDKRTSPRLVSAMAYREFFRECAKQFEHVVYVLGNHEHYDGNYDESYSVIKAALAEISPRFHVLEQEAVTLDGVVFVGSTLWTDMFKGDSLAVYHARERMSDYNCVRVAKKSYRKLQPADTMHDHWRSVQFIKTVAENNRASDTPKSIVVVSHHAPASLSLNPAYRGDLLNAAYYSDLSDLILDNPEIRLWIHGHLHNESDYMVGDQTRVVCNPRGYYGEQHADREIRLVYVDI